MTERRSGPPRIAVIGGGLTGLAAAHRFAQRARDAHRPIDLILLESRDRLGGAIWTHRRDGFTLEGGADSFITTKPHGVDLCRELGLGNRLVATDSANRRSFVVRGGRLLPVPEGFVLMAPSRLIPVLTSPILSWSGKFRLLLDLILPRRDDDADESLASFTRRRLGREALERLVQPLVGGIYTGDPAELSLKATLPQFAAMEARYGSLIRGTKRESRRSRPSSRDESGARYGMFVTLQDGMGTLPKALAESLGTDVIRTQTPVRRLTRGESLAPWRIELLDGRALDVDAVVLATEAHSAARLVDSLDPTLALSLRSVPYASSAIVHLGYRRDQIAHPLDGFGVVVPAVENRSILAVSFTSVKFPMRAPAGQVLMRVFIGGAMQSDLYDREDDDLAEIARRELESLIGARGEPLLSEVSRHSRAMPQYTLGHLDRIATLRERASLHSGLALAGNYLDGVGIPDCIRSGQSAAEAILATHIQLENVAAA